MPTASNSSAPDNKTVQSFSSATFAAVTVPATATGVYIVPASTNTGNITLKGVTGDTGLALHQTQPSFISIIGGTTAFGLLCANATVMEFIWT